MFTKIYLQPFKTKKTIKFIIENTVDYDKKKVGWQ